MSVRRLIIDHEKGLISVMLDDGVMRVERSQRTPPPPDALGLIRSECDLATRELHLTLPSRRRITLEIGGAGARDQPAPGRKVLYLDQNHWRTLTRALHDPEGLTANEAEAATTIIALARAKRIILPLSSAHAYETGRTYGALRRELATTMLDLSRGWQMRSPLGVRQDELRASMTGVAPIARAVFTLDPDVMFSDRSSESAAPTIDAAEPVQELHRRLTNVSSIAAAMIEEDQSESREARGLATGWAELYEALSRRLHEDEASADQVRAATTMTLLADLKNEIAEAALSSRQTPEAVAAWMEARAQDHFGRMPYLGRLHGLLFRRIRNAGEKWHGNDLTDAHFLSCAAGYAQVVVGERRHAAYLSTPAASTDHGACVCRTLSQAAARLTVGD